ncbi:MAG: 2OG-Fe(II) oxygenase [Gammaproteobacteria bacterium]
MGSQLATRRNAPCPCGSGRRFKHCCGKTPAGIERFPVEPLTMMMTPAVATALYSQCNGEKRVDHQGVLSIEGFLSESECERLVALSADQPSEQARVRMADETAAGGIVSRDSAVRITSTIKTFGIAEQIVPLVGRAFFDCVQPHFDTRIQWFEFPDILKYVPGGHYGTHNDSEVWDEQADGWRLVEDRQYSLLIYLNSEFTGGALRFDDLELTIQPKAGMLVAFPSDHRYAHTALPVESGTRYAIVSWGAAVGAPRVHQGATLGVVYTAPEFVPPRLRGLRSQDS